MAAGLAKKLNLKDGMKASPFGIRPSADLLEMVAESEQRRL